MKRTYLEEDLELIRKYFPGARAASIRTPFDLTHGGGNRLPRLTLSSFHDTDGPSGNWAKDILWTR